MPNIYDGISGEKLVEEINSAIDSRGKDGVSRQEQTINSPLIINGNVNMPKNNIQVKSINGHEENANVIRYINDFILKSDINIKRDASGNIKYIEKDLNTIVFDTSSTGSQGASRKDGNSKQTVAGELNFKFDMSNILAEKHYSYLNSYDSLHIINSSVLNYHSSGLGWRADAALKVTEKSYKVIIYNDSTSKVISEYEHSDSNSVHLEESTTYGIGFPDIDFLKSSYPTRYRVKVNYSFKIEFVNAEYGFFTIGFPTYVYFKEKYVDRYIEPTL